MRIYTLMVLTFCTAAAAADVTKSAFTISRIARSLLLLFYDPIIYLSRETTYKPTPPTPTVSLLTIVYLH